MPGGTLLCPAQNGHQALYLLNILGVDENDGAPEQGEAYGKGVGTIGIGPYFTFKATKTAADYAHIVVHAEDGRYELDWFVGLAEHEFQFLNFGISDNGHGLVEATGIGSPINHKTVDIHEIDKLATLFLRALHKYYGRYYDAVHVLAASVCPYVEFALGCHI